MSKKSLNKKMDKLLALETSGQLKTTNSSRMLRKIKSNKLAVVGIVLFALIMILCIFAPLFTKFDSEQFIMKDRMQSPNGTYIFGTDELGRDIWARMLYGGRISILVGLGSALGSALIGVSLGTFGAYKGGILDATFVKLGDIFLSFPQIVLVIIISAITGPSLSNLIIIFILTGWPSMYRLTRSQILSIKEQEYVQALKAFGVNDFKICFKHMLPNATGPIFVNITLSTAMFILQESALSFLGLGVPGEVATWGNIINAVNGRYDLLIEAWWLWLPAGIMLTLFVLSINFVGDGLRDATDPTQMG